MRLVYFGTPDFASRCLEKILSSQHQVAAVVTAPDSPRGRGMKLEPPEVKRLALSRGLELLQPANLKNSEFLQKLLSYHAELFCVVAFRILPEQVYSMPRRGCINLHASLLPKFRGAAPINWAIINGEKETGLTTFYIRKKVDTGDMLVQDKLEIGPDETYGELHDRMAILGGELLIRTIDKIEKGDIEPVCQDNAQASAAPKLTPAMGDIDWSGKAIEVHNLVRGLSPQPGAYSLKNNKKILILRTRPVKIETKLAAPGVVMQADPRKGIVVACGDGAVEILQLKPESGRAITGAEYVRGHRLIAGESFERKFGN
jgi:methionyl-tRNA formyltransferase